MPVCVAGNPSITAVASLGRFLRIGSAQASPGFDCQTAADEEVVMKNIYIIIINYTNNLRYTFSFIILF